MGLAIGGTAEVDVRYTFTAQYLCGSALFAHRCAEIEQADPATVDEKTRTEHRGLAVAAIMQSAAAVEAESAELTLHSPGNHLGSNEIDRQARDFLLPLADVIDGLDALSRYKTILHLLGKPPFDEGAQPWQGMTTLVRVRNELVHYKSKWGKEMDRVKLFKTLEQLRLATPPFVHPNTVFFPHKFIGAASAAWAVRTAVAFVNGFYDRMGIESRLKHCMDQFAGL